MSSRCQPRQSPVSLESRPHLAVNIKGLALLLPLLCRTHRRSHTGIAHVCKLERIGGAFSRMSSPSTWIARAQVFVGDLNDHPFQLTKFVNGYFSQDANFREFLISQLSLKSLEIHSGKTNVSRSELFCRPLKSLGCPPQFLFKCYSILEKRLRLDFERSTDICEIDLLRRLWNSTHRGHKTMKSLAIFLKQKQSHFPEILRVIDRRHLDIQHLEIHQFFPTQVRP